MKKIFTSLLMLSFVCMTSYAQEYLNESFDADIPSTWTTSSEQDSYPWFWNDGTGFQSIDGTGYARVDADAAGSANNLVENLETPEFDASAGNIIIVQFDTYYNNYVGSDTGYVQVWDGTEWHTAWDSNSDEIGSWSNPEPITVIITDFVNPSGNTKVRFRYDDGDTWAWYWAIDNVVISSVDCLSPINVAITPGAVVADVAWDSGSGLTNLIWGPEGFDPLTEGTTVNDAANPYTITGIDPLTAYDVYLQDDCGVDGLSPWNGPNTFNTTVACPDPSWNWDPWVESSFTAELTFQQNGAGDVYLIYGPADFVLGAAGDTVGPITSPYTLTGLDAETDYDSYIYMDCTANPDDSLGYSNEIGPKGFFTLPSCPEVYVPFNVFSNVTTSSIDIDGFYAQGPGDVYFIIGDLGFILGETGDTIGPVTAPYTIDGLETLSFHDVYWFMDCTADGYGYSVNSTVKSFNTLTDAAGTSCADPVILNNNLPYIVTEQSLCGYGDNVTLSPTACGNWVSGYEEIVFAYAPETDDQVLGIYGSNFNTNSTVYFEIVDMCPDSADAACVSSGSWTTWSGESTFLLDDAELVNGETYYVMITGYTGSGCTFDLNIFVIDCATPSLLNYIPTPDSTILSWNSNSEAPSWQVEWGPEGFEVGTGTFVNGDYGVEGPPISIDGLSDTVNYEFYVTDICGFGNQSIPAGPSLFTGPPPVNDLCTNATPIDCGSVTAGNISSATDSLSAGIATCNQWTFLQGPSVWYTFEGTGNEVVLTTCGAEFYNQIFVYTGDCNDSLFCETYSTGNWYQGSYQCDAGNWEGVYLSMLTELGTTYYVAVTGSGSATGTFDLSMDCIPCSAPAYLEVDTYSDTQVQFTWESLNMGATYNYELVDCGAEMGTGTSGSGTVESATPVEIVTGLLPNTCYDIYLYESCQDGSGSDTIMTNFTTNEFAPPLNDQCTGATPLACGEIDTSSTVYATTFGNPGPDFYCNDTWDFMDAKNVWWEITGTGQEMNVGTCGSNINGNSYYTDLFILTGSCDSLECVTQSSYATVDGCDIFGSTNASFFGELGVTYYVAVSGTWSGATGGEVVVTLNCIPCSTPSNVTSTQTDALANITWESFNSPADFTLVWDTCGFDFPTETGNVITGNTGTDLPVLIEGLDSASCYDVYIFEYCESIGGNSDTVMYSFNTNDSPPPANDEPCNAVALTAGDTLVTSNSWASASPGEPVPESGSCNDPDQMLWCNSNITTSTWYTFTPTMGGWATISTCHSNSYDTQLATYTAEDCNDWTTYSLVAANDDMGDCSVATNFTSAVSMCLEAGVTYYIQVDPYSTPSEWNPNPGQEFSISVEFSGAMIDNNTEFVLGPNTATVNWAYNSDDGLDVDYMFIYTNTTTGVADTILANTSDLPLLLEGLDDDAVYEYMIYSDDVCSTTSGPHSFMTPVDGINELSFGGNVNVYPNPVNDKLTIEINAKIDAGSVISIINLQGKAIYMETVNENVSNYRSEIDVNNFARGIYILKLEDENSSIQERIIVQ